MSRNPHAATQTGAVYERVSGRIDPLALDPAKIKGHSEVEIFAVDGIIN